MHVRSICPDGTRDQALSLAVRRHGADSLVVSRSRRTRPSCGYWLISPSGCRRTRCARRHEQKPGGGVHARVDPVAAGFPIQVHVEVTLGAHTLAADNRFRQLVRKTPADHLRRARSRRDRRDPARRRTGHRRAAIGDPRALAEWGCAAGRDAASPRAAQGAERASLRWGLTSDRCGARPSDGEPPQP
jgi:hypothetical protein